jgi:hypothetical protein
MISEKEFAMDGKGKGHCIILQKQLLYSSLAYTVGLIQYNCIEKIIS